ncbi:hypothetical protein GCM10011416_18840 [Polaribacter pacificus]|uniref:Uncharacterized protein n=1 Tax=Polaribacter pacificus TaxID=1775173 RepID=A0A917MDW9_9FLAO|nr:DUF6095 family protein [Polaribacter pacificus]GGH00511.1 hypothetical protein GCM10011416_18840 [Polaribacter pacificus]
MSINNQLLSKGIKQATLLLFLLISTPILITVAFKALNISDQEEQWTAYLLLSAAAIMVVITMVLAFKTIRTLLDALFNSKES